MTAFYVNPAFWMYALAALPYLAFVGFYAVRSPMWRRTAVGRGLMSQALSLAAVFTYICVLLAFDVPASIRDGLRGLLIGGVTIAGTLMLKNLLREQSRPPGDDP